MKPARIVSVLAVAVALACSAARAGDTACPDARAL